jgi:hypothetical protein
MKTQLFVLSIGLLLGACAPIYRQSVVHAPLYQEQGDFSASVHTGMNDVDVHVGGAILNNLGLVVSGSTINQGSDYMTEVLKYRSNHMQIMPGYFVKTNNWLFEFYGGYGFGYSEIDLNQTYYLEDFTFANSYIRGNYSQILLQPGIGFTSNFFDIAFHVRTMLNQYHQSAETSEDLALVKNMQSFITPTITTRFGYKYAKMMIQVGLMAPMRPNNVNEYNPLNISVGMHFDIRKSYRK